MSCQQAQPITRRIVPKRQEAARHYGSHPYFTRRPWNVVQAYIEHFSRQGDTVLDPFGGSGVTAVEALVLKRRAIHVDINPLANFITRQVAISPVNLAYLSEAFEKVRQACAPTLAEWRKQPDEYFQDGEPPFWYPKGVKLPKNSDARSVEDLFTRRQLFILSLILEHISRERHRQLRDLLRFCFSATLAKTNRTFISARNRAESRGGPTIFSVYRYAIPSTPVELDPWEQFAARFRRLVLCKRETNKLIGDFYSEKSCRILKGSATSLTRVLRPTSVDYVFTDPPYGAHIAYLDLSTMWNAWLSFEVSDAEAKQEIICGGDAQHSRQHYIESLRKSIEGICYLLKPQGWLSLVFEHKDASFYSSIIEAAESAGLRHINTVSQSVDVVWSMHKKKNRMNVLSGELILNFRKTPILRPKSHKVHELDLSRLIRDVASEQLRAHAGARTEDIFNNLMVRLIDSRLLSTQRVTLDSVLNTLAASGFTFDPDSGRWYPGDKPERRQARLFF